MKLGKWTVVVRLNGWRSLEPPGWVAAYQWWRGSYLVGASAGAKHRHLRDLLEVRGHRVFVEAGTYKGATTAYMSRYAERVISVELDDGLFAAAKDRFAERTNVELIHGDSMVEVPKVVADCTTPPLVFLDGHFSGPGTAEGAVMEPSLDTLSRLADVSPPGTTVVVDDLRLFGSGLLGHPQLDTIGAAARTAFPDALIRAGLDSIVIET